MIRLQAGGTVMASNKNIETDLESNDNVKAVYTCSICSVEYTTKGDPFRHKEHVHLGKTDTLKCHICQRELSNKHKLKRHIETVHRPKENDTESCYICKAKFKTNGYLERHVRLVHHQKQLSCDVCSQEFGAKEEYRRHIAIHTRPKCSLCRESFVSIRRLIEHEKTIHGNERPFECSVCKKSFKTKGNLTEHLTCHSDERKFECNLCQKSFARRPHLKEHMQIHSEKKTISVYQM
ncbi:gastrula zinc finger protein XlCGF67.1-like [Mercenaria mercenaria]|uniref:gastrula zinc finger protein XlCGF67.1-like n=1 Tax=Mercenaria mercenaria TaxID=6596 RepID=UPI00234E56D3|nr:gastrula zinc finger protein XlCGF67.1-like [Mercenaria mercenaria]